LEHSKKYRCFTLFWRISLLILLLISVAYPGTSGKITGRVFESKSDAPLIGCNLVLEDTYLGAASDMNGNYMIINVPPGVYRLRAQMMGYQTKVVKEVIVSVDLTTTIDFELAPEVISGEEVVVVAQHKMIVKKSWKVYR
jgi:hypothetical protein